MWILRYDYNYNYWKITEMGSLFVSHLVPSVQATFSRQRSSYATSKGFSGDSFFLRKIKKQICYFHISHSKRSVYQDFQDFAKPLHLLPATPVTTYSTHSSEEIISSLELDPSTSFYMVEFCTSRDFGSCLRDLNAAIMICLIDENGRSILQRIPTISQGENMKTSEYIHFQRGSIDTSTFKGPKLEKIAALWIGLESGSWRVNGVCLKIINGSTTTSAYLTGDKQSCYFSGMQYKFEANNILLGNGGGLSVIELRPTLVTQLLSIGSSPVTPSFDPLVLKEGSMKEYAALKFSLLFYDFILIVTCAMILTVFSNEMDVTYSFLVGGIGGFLYLLLLQRSVDGLSVSSSSSEDDDHMVEMSPQSYGFEKAMMILVPVILASAVSSKNWMMGGQSAVFSSSQIFAGVAGFLTCKIAVVLAAFKPIQMCIKEIRMPNQDQYEKGGNDGTTRSASDILREDDNDV